ncbi:MAG: aminomethyl-transferring glycine dehydrogenase [Planctomycetes bacterium]|nr:aminomethyl-transferring glycine dehydrogenase [Planctomycetota bacterium]
MTDDLLKPSDTFVRRHLGPREHELAEMLERIGYASLDALADAVVPAAIRLKKPMKLTGLDKVRGEFELVASLRKMAEQNQVMRSMIGMGYYDTIVPPVIGRNILENPGWYTQYTPYQAEISQGRLEALLNFQTMVSDLTALPLAGASLLDEGTAAAEAMAMCFAVANHDKPAFFIADDCHPQTINVVRTRAISMGIELRVGPVGSIDLSSQDICGVLVQYPNTTGQIHDYADLAAQVHGADALLVVATDLLALTLLKAPGEFGADIAVGSSQRFGVPMGYGGPHAAFLSTHEKYARKMPGRLVGVSRDSAGNPAYRLSIQTREQHIKRDRATSNICTAQVLLAIMAGMYAVYHGPEGLTRIARRVHGYASLLARGVQRLGHALLTTTYFDTLAVEPATPAGPIVAGALKRGLNLRRFADGSIGIALDETTTRADIADVLAAFNEGVVPEWFADEAASADDLTVDQRLVRRSSFLTHPVFNAYHAEHEMLRYIRRLESRDLSLCHSMIPLGSCTMKLNATSEMIPVTWPQFGKLHPFAPADQAKGYAKLFEDLETWLAQVTGFAAVSLQPNAGSQGEYAGLLAIRGYHEARNDTHRTVCLIPTSAHGTNPASAVIAGFSVVTVACDANGNIDLDDLAAKATEHADNLAALMITYPSTHGVFEAGVRDACRIVHERGGLVYMDGANMNAQVGLTSPGEIGADVCHLNLHKTFCIPHGGGGPGMGPIAVNDKLKDFLPSHPLVEDAAVGPVSAAPWGSASILPISWVYIALMGAEGLTRATQVAILNANYIARRLAGHYDVVYTGQHGLVAHECIMDCREFLHSAHVSVEDIAKRLMDYGFHAPTMSWPVGGTLMIEPTESESKAELDRFCDAMISIREEIRAIERGDMDGEDNPLHHAPHTAAVVTADEWTRKYSRQQAAYPAPWLKQYKFWPSVGRIDNPYGDRNLICTCPPLSAYGK